MKRLLTLITFCCLLTAAMPTAHGQGLTDMRHSQQAVMQNMPLGATRWTGGFWGDRCSF